MKIRIVLCHPGEVVDGEERQVFLADALAAEGHDVAVYRITFAESHEGRYRDSDSAISFFGSDSAKRHAHDAYSTSLLETLKKDDADVILVKGVDYQQANRIFECGFRGEIGVIVGGVSDHPLLDRSPIIYFETEQQNNRYRGPARTCVLPKYIDWTTLDSIDKRDKVYDIVNIGNFDEDRKGQELLFPISYLFRVLFIGAGHRLDSFKSVASTRSTAEFAGYIGREEVFDRLVSSRIMVHPSLWDGYPRSVAEAFAAGVPVVGLESVLGGVTTKPFLIGTDIERLVPTVCSLLRDPERLTDLGNQAEQYMREEASHENLIHRFKSLIIDM